MIVETCDGCGKKIPQGSGIHVDGGNKACSTRCVRKIEERMEKDANVTKSLFKKFGIFAILLYPFIIIWRILRWLIRHS